MNRKRNNKNKEFEIILELLKGKEHIRELSRKISIPLTTLLRQLDYLGKENIVDYSQEGRNKSYYLKKNGETLNFVKMAEFYKFKKITSLYPELAVIFEEIIKRSESKMIVLFGSYAKTSAKKDSDIDIYIETLDKKEKQEIEDINSKINVKIGNFDSENLLIKEIIKNHVIIKGVDEFYEKNKIFI